MFQIITNQNKLVKWWYEYITIKLKGHNIIINYYSFLRNFFFNGIIVKYSNLLQKKKMSTKHMYTGMKRHFYNDKKKRYIQKY